MKIIYVGTLNKVGNCYFRMKALQALGCEVSPIDTKPEIVEKKQERLSYRVRRRLFGPSDLAKANEKILGALKRGSFDLLWIDKGITIRPDTLHAVKEICPEIVIAGYSPDDILNPDNRSRNFINSLPYYDIYFTANPHNVGELKDLECSRTIFSERGYHPETHRPVAVTGQDRLEFGGQVGFIGTYERERAGSILYLAKNGINIRVWGKGWKKKRWLNHPKIRIEGKPLWNDDYAKAISSFDINLCFLRKVNRDVQTTRSVSIPACGGFMLAERTGEHCSLFKEGMEAEFFSTDHELLNKVRYYLENEKQRKAIAQMGHERCISSGYSNKERLAEMLGNIKSVSYRRN